MLLWDLLFLYNNTHQSCDDYEMKDLIPFPKLVLLSSDVPPNFLNFRVVIVIRIDNFVLIQLFIVLPGCL